MTLNLEDLRTGLMGLTPEYGCFCLQACTVCLEHSNHLNGVNVTLTGTSPNTLTLNWSSAVTEQVKRSWRDLQEATEFGATAIAILLASRLSIFKCIERSSKGTSFYYWLGDEDNLGIFQRKEALEISGILAESSTNTLADRMRSKERQTKRSATSITNTHICVTEFSSPKCEYKIT